MDVRLLAALRAEGTGQRRAAIEAVRFVRVALRNLAGARLDGAGEQTAGHRITDRFEFAGHQSP